ncbi:hypothetical protein AX774_g1794 [Zancudomyces culisetae]|uniref:Uncharacterized protein n=1 Tax=Zancudomyces culisetae TaxID=1213189 RepID=A0A1R1PUS1_ZANCU|nr:hypothetical protein AX774_g1794 [Zancudomyces culisetae]|eukprot:OMH84663.1 hypothetical protein AX774_g1794 [Zancudomyces culisetae]
MKKMVTIGLAGVSATCAMLAENARASGLADRDILSDLLEGLGFGNIGNLISGITGELTNIGKIGSRSTATASSTSSSKPACNNILENLLFGVTGGLSSVLGGGDLIGDLISLFTKECLLCGLGSS